jgi:hypothetical protein
LLHRPLHSRNFLLLFFFLVPACFPSISAQAQPQLPGLGDSPSETDAGSLASDLSPAFHKLDVARVLRKVADWQLPRVQQHYSQDWTFAALYTGFMAVPPVVHGSTYQDAMRQMGKQFNWQPGPRAEHADDQAVGQTYIELYDRARDPEMLSPIRQRMDTLIQRVDDPASPLWWWCDALFMAPSVLADLSKVTGDPKYLNFMDREWWTTSSLLYDPQLHLYSRDDSFLDKHEANGAKVFWSRGNGWVMAGLVRVLAVMPRNYPHRQLYIQQFQQMARRLPPSRVKMAYGVLACSMLNPISFPRYLDRPLTRTRWPGEYTTDCLIAKSIFPSCRRPGPVCSCTSIRMAAWDAFNPSEPRPDNSLPHQVMSLELVHFSSLALRSTSCPIDRVCN